MTDSFDNVSGNQTVPREESKPRAQDIARAIADIDECRGIHVQYVDWLKAYPGEAATPSKEPVADLVGDVAHHQKWVDNYANVLAILRSLQAAT